MGGRTKLARREPDAAAPRQSSAVPAGTKGVPRAEREQQILDVAAEEFGRRGYAAVSVLDVAQAAGISKPLIYGYFTSKEGLYCACVDRAGQLITTAIARVLDDPVDAVSTAEATLRAIFTALEPRPHDWHVLYDRSLPPGSRALAAAKRHRTTIAAQAAQGVAVALRSTELIDPLDQSAVTEIWMSAVSALIDWWLKNPDQTAQQMTHRCHRILAAFNT
jgi:AcrR family transcriptional regulator